MKLSRISLALLPLLSLGTVHAVNYNAGISPAYKVEEIGVVNEVKSTYAAALNDLGESVFNGAIRVDKLDTSGYSYTEFQYFNFPIDLSVIDFTSESVQSYFTEEQLAKIAAGNIDNDILTILLRVNPGAQQVGTSLGYLQNVNGVSNVLLRDSQASRSNSEFLYDINNYSQAVGTASTTFSLQSFTPKATELTPEPSPIDLWVPDGPKQLGVVSLNGSNTILPPAYVDYGGGYSVATSISDNGFIAGYGSVSLDADVITAIEADCIGETLPVASCLYNRSGNYNERGFIWQLEADGSVGAPTVLGFLGNKNTGEVYTYPDSDRKDYYYSRAYDVNDNGIAVGFSMYSDSDRKIEYSTGYSYYEGIYFQGHATLFVDGQALPLVDMKEWGFDSYATVASQAVAINNNNIAVGYAAKYINSYLRSKMFVYDHSSKTTEFVDGFFTSSTTIPRAISDTNMVVGQAEVIMSGTTTRRTHGFIYDLTTKNFVDLNTFLACDSPYNIVDAVDINNYGEILATALVTKPRKDLLGDIVTDADGKELTENLAVTIKLTPDANGQVQDCNVDEQTYERQGGSIGIIGLLFGGILLWLRRRSL